MYCFCCFLASYAATHLVPYCSAEHLTSWHCWSGLHPSPPPKDSYTHFRGQASGLASRVPPVMFFNSFLLNLAVLFNFRDFMIFSFKLVYTQWTPDSSSGPPQLNGRQSMLLGQPNISGVLSSWYVHSWGHKGLKMFPPVTPLSSFLFSFFPCLSKLLFNMILKFIVNGFY